MNHEIQPGDDARDDGSQIVLPCGPITIGTFVCPSGMFGGASAVMAALSATSFFVQHDVIIHSPPIASHIVRVDPVERRHSGILVHMPLAFERRSHPTFSMGGLALPFEPLAIIRGGSYPGLQVLCASRLYCPHASRRVGFGTGDIPIIFRTATFDFRICLSHLVRMPPPHQGSEDKVTVRP